jgi:hypothetical protein
MIIPKVNMDDRYFKRLTPDSSMERCAYYIQLEGKRSNLASLLFVQNKDDFFPAETLQNLTPQDVWVRRERQTFRRLPRSDAIAFTVHTSLTCLIDLDYMQLEGLANEIRGWDESVAEYRRRHLWGRCVLDYCDKTGLEATA